MKTARLLAAVVALVVFSSVARANLVNDGDFQNGSQVVYGSLTPSTGPYGAWLGTHGGGVTAGLTDWWIVAESDAGKAAGDYYAKHFVNTSKLYQGIDINASTTLPIGSLLSLSFDYIYSGGFTGSQQSAVYLLGFLGGEPNLDPWFPGAPFPFGDVLYSATLSSFTSAWTPFSASGISVTKDYDSLALVFFAGAFGSTGIPGIRGIDNITLNSTVPEPSAMLLIGPGLAGLAVLRRKLKR
jgi:hypothetical protein